jgi:hypothetical protein
VTFVLACEGIQKLVWADDTGYIMTDQQRFARFDW